MRTCELLIIVEGPTDAAFVRQCMIRCRGAIEVGWLEGLIFPSGQQPNNPRGKYSVAGHMVGLIIPGRSGGIDEAEKALTVIAREYSRGICPNLKMLVLVRDLNRHSSAELSRGFYDRLRNFANREGVDINRLQEEPARVSLGTLRISQILLGDSTFGEPDHNAVDDHIVGFLLNQPERNPAVLVQSLGDNIGRPASSKQIVTLAMAIDEYFGGPAGFYDRVLQYAPELELTALATSLGLTQLFDDLELE